eukprot:TRINITY_DN7423_c0_g1_i1.p1 TRINITY_DN7423_c0_g1~~TRINITY_DN7423_c0_g1_i1.p1  ORF type:complete len:587 (+),score=96.79 TRINITY_DN7423_c0_g1_i1:159-1763(+)
MLETLARMKTLIREYKKWNEQPEVQMKSRQHLAQIKEVEEQKILHNKLKTSLTNCQLIGTRYLEENNRLPIKKDTTMTRLKIMGSSVAGMSFIGNEHDPLDPVYLVCANVMVDIQLNVDTGTAESVQFRVGDDTEELLSQQLLQKLQSFQFLEFEKLLARATARYYHLDLLKKVVSPNSSMGMETEEDDVDLNLVISVFEQDLVKIHQHEMSVFGQDECQNSHTGIISKQCSGYSINFRSSLISKSDILESTLIDNPDPNSYFALVRLEESASSVRLPLTSSIQELSNDGRIIFQKPEQNNLTREVPLTFVILLEPSIALTLKSLHKITQITGLHKAFGSGKETKLWVNNTTESPAGVAIHSLLTGDDRTQQNTLHVAGRKHKYIQNSVGSGAIVVSRIPFINIEDLLPILSILRQQIVFNNLYSSCLAPRAASKKRKHEDDFEEKEELQVEVSYVAPISLGLKFSVLGVWYEIKVTISPNGVITCEEDTRGNPENKVSMTELCQELQKSNDVPSTLEKLFFGSEEAEGMKVEF